MPSSMIGVFIPLLSAILLISLCNAEVNDDIRDRTLVSAKCNYLNSDENQHNAFVHVDDGERRVCCMCMQHTKYIGPCNPSHPNTTICGQCEEGWDTDFEPHLEDKCEVEIRCPDRRMLHPKCVCPEGMTERKSDRACIPNPITPTPKPTTVPITVPTQTTTVTTTISRTTSQQSRKTISPNVMAPSSSKGTLMERITSSTKLNIVPESVDKPLVPEQTTTTNVLHNNSELPMENNDNTEPKPTVKPDQPQPEKGSNWLGVLGVICGLAGLVGVVLAIWYIRHRKRQPQPDSPSEDGKQVPSSAEETPSDSFLSLLKKSERNETESTLTGVRKKLRSKCLLRSHKERTEAPNLAGPIRNSQRDNRADCDLLATVAPLLPRDINPNVDLLPAEIARNRKFAENVGEKFKTAISKNEVVPIYRCILAEDKDEDEFENLQGKHQHDKKELVYQLMLFAIRKKGKKLTPQYLLVKVENAEPRLQNLVDIINDEMAKPYMQGPAHLNNI